MNFSFCIDIKPVAKERPRKGKFGFYTPKKTQDFENAVKMCTPKLLLSYRISIKIELIFKRPKKPSKEYPSRADVDNHAKAVLDAMNNKLYLDDSQVCILLVSKSWGEKDCIKISGHSY